MPVNIRKDITGSKGKELANKNIIIGLCGSVGVVRAPEIARELMRHGAEIKTVMTKAAQKLIGPQLMEWATGNPVITELTGKTEHIQYCGKKECTDLLLICPCTANTLGKIAHGIDDTTVTTYATTSLGSGIPIIIVPGMHETMYKHPIVQENLKKLEKSGIKIIKPVREEEKAKIPLKKSVVQEVLSLLE